VYVLVENIAMNRRRNFKVNSGNCMHKFLEMLYSSCVLKTLGVAPRLVLAAGLPHRPCQRYDDFRCDDEVIENRNSKIDIRYDLLLHDVDSERTAHIINTSS